MASAEHPRNVVCVNGATSQLGVFLLPRLRAAGFRVLALSRRAPSRPLQVADGVMWADTRVVADGMRPEPAAGHPAPDYLVSCGPLSIASALVTRYPGLRRVVAFSSSSVVSKTESPNARERAQIEAMADAECILAAGCSERGLPLLLLRPTLIYGCGMDHNVSLLARLARRRGVVPLAGQARGLRQPVHADDLADLAVRALTATAPADIISPVCGGSTLTFREMAERVAALLPGRIWLPALPEGLLALMAGMLSRSARWRGINAEMVRRQNRDLVFDDSALRAVFGWTPRPFEPKPVDFEMPEQCRRLQLPV
jgi:nucleoside-diphosphate-sugar epimerase